MRFVSTRSLSIAVLLSAVACWTATAPTVTAADSAEVTSEADVGGEDHGAAGEHGHADPHGHGGGHGDTNPVTLDPDLALVTAVIFLGLLGVLWKFAWGPVVEALDKREKNVAQQLAEAASNQQQAQQLLAEHESKLSAASIEVKQLLDQARKDAESQKQEILDSAQAAAAAEKDRAVREITAAKNAALQDLAQKSVDTAVDLAGKIVKRQLNQDDHSELIGESLQHFSSDS